MNAERTLAAYVERSKNIFQAFPGGIHRKVFFIVPVFREHRRLYPVSEQNPQGEDFVRKKIEQLEALFNGRGDFSWRLVYVDDGDFVHRSGRLIDEFLNRHFPTHRTSGQIRVLFLEELDPGVAQVSKKGGAVYAAMKEVLREAADEDIVIYTDADLSSDLGLTGALLAPLLNGADVSVASRWHRESTVVNRGWLSRVSSWIYNLLVRVILRLPFTDTQNGFKAFRVPALRAVLPHCEDIGFSFDTELLGFLQAGGFRLVEIPIYWSDSRLESNTNLFKDTRVMIASLLRQKKRIADFRRKARR